MVGYAKTACCADEWAQPAVSLGEIYRMLSFRRFAFVFNRYKITGC